MSCPPLDCPPDALPVHVESQCCKVCKGESITPTLYFSGVKLVLEAGAFLMTFAGPGNSGDVSRSGKFDLRRT